MKPPHSFSTSQVEANNHRTHESNQLVEESYFGEIGVTGKRNERST